jgi:hypothetical protein
LRPARARPNDIRLLASLAFISPRVIAALIDGTARADLTVAGLARTLPHSWAEQERQFGLPARVNDDGVTVNVRPKRSSGKCRAAGLLHERTPVQ